VLSADGWGLCYEPGAKPTRAQPIMVAQQVHIQIGHNNIKQGTQVSISGQATPHLHNDQVTLQKLVGKTWTNVKTTGESTTGKFTFKLAAYSHEFRAMVKDVPGYFQFGYSNNIKLTTKKA
jgi:hypothetical protein